MLKSIEAIITSDGRIALKESVSLKSAHKAIVTILDEEVKLSNLSEIALLSEEALAKDWNKPEEDEAWALLQPEQ